MEGGGGEAEARWWRDGADVDVGVGVVVIGIGIGVACLCCPHCVQTIAGDKNCFLFRRSFLAVFVCPLTCAVHYKQIAPLTNSLLFATHNSRHRQDHVNGGQLGAASELTLRNSRTCGKDGRWWKQDHAGGRGGRWREGKGKEVGGGGGVE